MQLVEVPDQIGAKLDRGGQIDIIYLDMSKAFEQSKPRKTPKEATSVWFWGEPAIMARIVPAQSIPVSDYIGCNIEPLTSVIRGPTGFDPGPHVVPSVCELCQMQLDQARYKGFQRSHQSAMQNNFKRTYVT